MLNTLRENRVLRIFILVFLIFLMIETLLSVIVTERQREMVLRNFEDTLRGVAVLLTETLRENRDMTEVEGLFDRLLRIRRVYSVELVSAKGDSILLKNKPFTGKTLRILKLQLGEKYTLIVRYSPEISGISYTAVFIQSGLIFVLALVLYLLFQNSISGPLKYLSHLLDRAAVGDLTVNIPSSHGVPVIREVSQRSTLLLDRLKDVIDRLKGGFRNIVAAIEQLLLNQDSLTEKSIKEGQEIKTLKMGVESIDTILEDAIDTTKRLHGITEENQSAILQMKASTDEILQAADDILRDLQQLSMLSSEFEENNSSLGGLLDRAVNSIENASSSVEEVRRAISEIDSAVSKTLQLSKDVTERVKEDGLESIEAITSSMRLMEDEVNHLQMTTRTLERHSTDIGEIVAVIRDIAEKTRLLSLNAQILAVQSGTEGRSFSVVAEQMSELAEKTADSTNTIAQIVADVKKQILHTSDKIKGVVKVVKQTKGDVENASEVFSRIRSASDATTEMVRTIKRATAEQSAGVSLLQEVIENLRSILKELQGGLYSQIESVRNYTSILSKVMDSIELIKNSTSQQKETAGYISENLQRSSEIVSSLIVHLKDDLNRTRGLESSFKNLAEIASAMERDTREVAQLMKSLYQEAEDLYRELQTYTTQGLSKSSRYSEGA